MIDEERHPTVATRAAGVEKLLPAGVIAFEIHGAGSPEDLFPSERECVARAVPKRVNEFAAGRVCARAALAASGFEPAPLLVADDRTPIWPAGAVGSITHTAGYCVAVVSLQNRLAGIGVDVEQLGHVKPSLWHMTMRPEEISALDSLDETQRLRTASILFSAKEAFYKCQYALTRQWLGFEDVRVTVATDTFELDIVNATHPIHAVRAQWTGRFSVNDRFVVTAISAEPAR